jgi:hypothetical protein
VADENAAVAWIHRNHSYSVDHALTHEGYAFVEVPAKPRTCFYIPPDAYVEGKGFVPSLVTEGEPGHAPLAGSDELAQPWYWGNTYEDAKAIALEENGKLGLTRDDVTEIILSSMRAQGFASND